MILHRNQRVLGVAVAVMTTLVGSSLTVPIEIDRPVVANTSCCEVKPIDKTDRPIETLPKEPSRTMVIPDTPVIDQNGRALRFYSDLVKDRVVAINFIFTTCNGVCPPMGAIFGQLGQQIGDRPIQLITVSLDPAIDTPDRLKAWADRFKAGPNWSLVTGSRSDLDGLLKALGAFSLEKNNHSPLILIGDDQSGDWRRLSGLTPPETILGGLNDLKTSARRSKPVPETDSPSARYFGAIRLINQDGQTIQLYRDLIQGKVVVVHVFFSECKNTCPLMLATDQKIQEHLGDRLGREVSLVAITVDPTHDRPDLLANYARRLNARAGWSLLTGKPEDTELALRKFGQAVGRREEHSNIYIIGNEKTGLWKKVQGLAPADQIIQVLDSVLNDHANSEGQKP